MKNILLFLLIGQLALAVRLKDIVDIRGVRSNHLVGYGLVVGLDGTGDSGATTTKSALKRMYEKLGITIEAAEINPKNSATVLISAELPAFARKGSRIDVYVSSMEGAKSLKGGRLIMSPLRAGDQNVYAVGQGSVVISDKANPTMGIISGGAIVEREVKNDFVNSKVLRLSLKDSDFVTAARITKLLNEQLSGKYATAMDNRTIDLIVPFGFEGKLVELMATVGGIDVEVDTPAKVVMNIRDGTVVIGKNVRISEVAISHEGLTIRIGANKGPRNQDEMLKLNRDPASSSELELRNLDSNGKQVGITRGATIDELVQGLNMLGATPKDLVSIFQSLKRVGALQADLEIL